MKSDKQFELLRDWIEAIVDEKIEQAFCRNSSLEELRRRKIEAELLNIIEVSTNGNEGKDGSKETNTEGEA